MIWWSYTELGNALYLGGLYIALYIAGRERRWRHKWNCSIKFCIPKLGGLCNGCSCWKAPGMFLPTLSISQLCNPYQPAPGELPKATQPLADTTPLLMWQLKHSSARTRRRKWARKCAGLKTFVRLFTIQIPPNSELIISRTRCRFPSEGVAHEKNVKGALVPNTANMCLLWEPVPLFPRKQEQREWCAISTDTPWHLTVTPTQSPPARAQGHTNGWLLPSDWETAAFTGVTRNFEITPTSLSLVSLQTKTPLLEGSASLSPNWLLQSPLSFSRVSLSSSPSIKALPHIPKVTEIWDVWISSCWGLPGSLKICVLPSQVSKNKRKIYYECKTCWEGKGTPMSNCLCTQRLVNTVQHLAATCAHSLWTKNLGIIFYTEKWSPPKQRTRMLSSKL